MKNKLNNILISILFCGLIIYQYLSLEHDIYFWDYARSWRIYAQFGGIIENTNYFFDSLLYSIKSQEYNAVSSVLLMPFYFLFPNGHTRFPFILGIALTYLIPTVLIIYQLVRQATNNQQPTTNNQQPTTNNTLFYLCFWTSITFIGFWKPILRGYTDIGGMIPILFCLYYVFKHDLTKKIHIKHAIIIGLTLWFAFLMRRWYAYTIASMYIILPIATLWYSHAQLSWEEKFKNCIANYFCAGCISFLCVFFFQQYLLQDILNSNYREAYSAYQLPSELNIKQFFGYLGYSITIIGISMWILCICFIKTSRKLLIVTAAIGVMSYLGFYRVATPDIHHFIPFSVWLLLPILIFTSWVWQNKNNIFSNIWIKLLPIMSCIILLISIFPYYPIQSRYLPDKTYPLYLKNYQNYLNLIDYLKILTQKDKKTFSIISADFHLNGSMIAHMISRQKLTMNMVFNPDIDLRDGLPIESLLTDYVVITSPAGTYLPHGQDNIKIISSLLIQKKGIGEHYQEINQFILDNNVEAIVYVKTSPFSRSNTENYLQQFIQLYPHWKHEYMNEETIKKLMDI